MPFWCDNQLVHLQAKKTGKSTQLDKYLVGNILLSLCVKSSYQHFCSLEETSNSCATSPFLRAQWQLTLLQTPLPNTIYWPSRLENKVAAGDGSCKAKTSWQDQQSIWMEPRAFEMNVHPLLSNQSQESFSFPVVFQCYPQIFILNFFLLLIINLE